VRQNLFAWLAGILVVTILATYIVVADDVPFKGHKQVNGKDVANNAWHLGLDLQGGIQLVLKAEPRPGVTLSSDLMNTVRNILEDRANATGANEPVVQTAGSDRILVELPGIENLDEAAAIIQQTGFLEYVSSGDTQLTEGTLVCTEKGGAPRAEVLAASGASTGSSTSAGSSSVVTGTQTAAGTPTTVAQATPTPFNCGTTYKTVVDGSEIDGSKVAVVYNNGLPQVSFTLKGDGPGKLARFTQENVGKYMPIVLDNKVVSSPVIKGIIPGGNGVIEGMTVAQSNALAIQLKYGALPVGLSLQESRKISATLGVDAINRSIIAGIIGLGLVVLFMLVYYRLPGALADVALIIYALVAAAVFKMWPITMTLAGIAGFILSIGMAVDANVLIFSRLKEELRLGKTINAAVEAGFDHAWPSIRDSNVSTIMTCIILFWFGSTFGGASIIKGFALTLLIGVIVSLFTAITVTRTFMRGIVRTNLAKSKWAFDIEDHENPTALTTLSES
jgi:preprotein translocase subunit SecD